MSTFYEIAIYFLFFLMKERNIKDVYIPMHFVLQIEFYIQCVYIYIYMIMIIYFKIKL